MDWSKKMKNAFDANKALLALVEKENRALSEEEKAAFAKNKAEIEEARLMLDARKELDAVENELKSPVNTGAPAGEPAAKKAKKVYNTLAEQLIDIRNAASGKVSAKLLEVQNALGLNEGVGSDGGYAIQDDFLGLILDTAVKEDGILNRVDTYQVSGGANRVSWTEVDETDISADIAGGVQTYWEAEAAEATASKPKFKAAELKLEKLMGLAYVTFEIDADSNFLDSYLERTFTTSIARNLAGAIISGNGVGKPTGILNGGGLVTVGKKGGQTAATIVWENITAIYNQALEPRSGGYVWLIHPDGQDQLDNMTKVVGTGGIPVYQPASMTGSVDTLRGLPVVYTDHCSALGTAGDIILADLSDYILPVKGQVQTDVSMHVEFLTAQNAYRFIFRANGRPKTLNQLTIKNSSKKRGRYVTVATRA